MRSTLALQPGSRSLLLVCLSSPSACSASLTMTKRIICGRRTLSNLSQFFFRSNVALQLNRRLPNAVPLSERSETRIFGRFRPFLRVVRGVEMLPTSHQFKLPSPPSRRHLEGHAHFSRFPEESDCTDAVSSFSNRTPSIVIVSTSMCGFLSWRFRCRRSSASVSIRARPPKPR